MLEFLRIVAGGVIIGVITGRILAENPTHVNRLRPSVWKKKLQQMSKKKLVGLLGWSALTVFLCFIVTGIVGGLLENANIRVVRPEADLTRRIAEVSKIMFLLFAILFPILEEWVFRGIFIDELLRLGVSKFEAVFVPALTFATFHLSNPGTEPAIILLLLPAGLLLGVCYLKAGLSGSIIAHSSYNFLIFVLNYL
ncbi:MAG: CPBP family intramembrane glutamic endopeptidase [Candidatus Hadarchaeales archaeon]